MSLKKIANELGLSSTTVSRALNGYDDVAAETRERIIDAAKRLGYQPNSLARRLKNGENRCHCFGVSITSTSVE